MHDQPLSHILTRIPGGRMAKHKALEHRGEFVACHMGAALAKSSNFINSVWKDTDKEKSNSPTNPGQDRRAKHLCHQGKVR